MTFQKAGKCVFAVRTLNTRDNVLAGVLLDCKKKNYNTNTRVFEFRSVKIQDRNMRSRGEAVLVATERERRAARHAPVGTSFTNRVGGGARGLPGSFMRPLRRGDLHFARCDAIIHCTRNHAPCNSTFHCHTGLQKTESKI